jgi:hypothetical protein
MEADVGTMITFFFERITTHEWLQRVQASAALFHKCWPRLEVTILLVPNGCRIGCSVLQNTTVDIICPVGWASTIIVHRWYKKAIRAVVGPPLASRVGKPDRPRHLLSLSPLQNTI